MSESGMMTTSHDHSGDHLLSDENLNRLERKINSMFMHATSDAKHIVQQNTSNTSGFTVSSKKKYAPCSSQFQADKTLQKTISGEDNGVCFLVLFLIVYM